MPPSSRRRWLLLPLALPPLLLLAALGLRWEERSRHARYLDQPPIELPPAAAADPAAWEALEAATRAAPGLDMDGRRALMDAVPVGEADEGEPPPDEPPPDWTLWTDSLAQVEGVLARPGLTAPPQDLWDSARGPDLPRLLEIGRASILRGRAATDPVERLRWTALPLRLGDRLAHAGGGLLPTLVGLVLMELSAGELQRLLPTVLATLPPPAPEEGEEEGQALAQEVAALAQEVAALAQEVATMEAAPPVLPLAIAQECAATERLLTHIAQDPALLPASAGWSPRLASWQVAWVYDPAVTVGWQRAWCAAAVEGARSGQALRDGPFELLDLAAPRSPRGLLFNPVGRLALSTSAFDPSSFTEREADSRAAVQALAAALGG